jgi:hypothetical protein
MVEVNYSLIGANGDTIAFDYDNYVLNPEFSGFNLVPSEVRIEQSAGDGGVFRNQKKGIREIDLAVTTIGNDRADVQTKLRRLSRLLQNALGPTTLRANYSDGDSVQMQVYYVGGAEGVWGSDAGFTWNKWVLSFQAPNPFWEKSQEISFLIGEEPTGRGLLPQLTKLKVASDNIFGEILVNNVGDVPSQPKWVILGPIENLVISNGTQSFTLLDPIAEGDSITIEVASGRVYDQDGENQYSLLGPAPKLFQIPAGQSEIIVTADETTDATRVGFFYRPRFEVVH